jgi:hypothetical protein
MAKRTRTPTIFLPRYTDGTPMFVDRDRSDGKVSRIRRLRKALDDIIDLPDDQVYLRAREIALRALLETES